MYAHNQVRIVIKHVEQIHVLNDSPILCLVLSKLSFDDKERMPDFARYG